jgi:sortase (surface protein transpeptidase)
VSASIVNVGLLADGSMGVPQRAADVAWYQPGPTPGENSNAILAGHYDWYGAQGAFFRLTELRAGDVISITRSDGSQVRFSVRETRWFGANDSPAEVFAPTPIATITLVTCGGVIDRATGTYDKRYVVRAVAL